MSAKMFLRYSAAIAKVLPDGPSLQIWSGLLVAHPRYSYFYMRYSKNNIPKTAVLVGIT